MKQSFIDGCLRKEKMSWNQSQNVSRRMNRKGSGRVKSYKCPVCRHFHISGR